MSWLRRCLLGLLVTTLVTSAAAHGAEPRRVLLLHSFGSHFAPWATISTWFREELRKQSPYGIDLFEAALQGERFGDTRAEDPFIDYLRDLFVGRDLGLVVAMGAPAARFFLRNRTRLFPDAPLLIAATDVRTFSEGVLTEKDTTVATTFDPAAHIDNILQVLPQTTDVVVAIGDSPLERFWIAELRRILQRFAGRLTFHWLNELSAEEMVKRVAELPPHHAIYYGTVRVDARGVPQEGDRIFSQFREVARAPIFSYVDSHFGEGIVGGPVLSTREVAHKSAAVAVRLLNGETPASIKTPPIGLGVPVYDWRELQRWHISESLLPPGSIVQFREPTSWEKYRAHLLGVMAVVLGQAALIGWLLYERRKRRRSETAAHDLSGRLIAAQEEERSRLARELHDDITQRLALLAIEAGREERAAANGAPAMSSVREGLVRLSEDVHALSYRLHPSILTDLGLREALKAECEQFAQMSSLSVNLNVDELPEHVAGDIGLCLFRVAQESLRNIARHASASRAEIRLSPSREGLYLTVKDNGSGFESSQSRTKASLGHASMRQRVALLGGKLNIESRRLEGTTITAWVPVRRTSPSTPARAAE